MSARIYIKKEFSYHIDRSTVLGKMVLKLKILCSKIVSVLKCTFAENLGVKSQHLHSSSEPSLTQGITGLRYHQGSKWCTDMHAKIKTTTHIVFKLKKK